MQFISNNNVNLIFKELLKEEFGVANYRNINLSDFEKGKVKYGYVSQYIKSLDPDNRDLLYKNTEFCMRITETNECNDVFMQIINHIILEVPRANEFDSIESQTKKHAQQNREFRQMQRDFNSKIESSNKDFKAMKNEFDRFENRIGNIQNEFIGILSIFSAIIIAFFGGIQVLGSVLTNVKDSNFYLLTMITIIIGLILFNVIYMLLYTISKIISKNIGISISKCEQCGNKNRLNCLISKYPIAFWYNSLSFFILIITFTIYNLDKYLIIKYTSDSFIWMISNKKYINLLLICLALIILVCLFIKFIFKPIKSKYIKISCANGNQNDSQVQVIENDSETNTCQVEIAITQDN